MFGFKKPLAFFDFASVNSVSYTNVLRNTFNLVIATPHQEIEFSMIDQADFAGINEYIQKHGLQDASLAAARRAKKLNVNKPGKKDSGQPNGTTARAEDQEEESELQKAERELQDQEDEEEEEDDDFDPGSEGESEGSGSDSEEDDDDEEGGDGYEEGETAEVEDDYDEPEPDAMEQHRCAEKNTGNDDNNNVSSFPCLAMTQLGTYVDTAC
jgi:hypothetical protein